MKILFVFPHSSQELEHYWKNESNCSFGGNCIVIQQFGQINSRVVDQIVSFICNYNFQKNSEFGVIIHSSNTQIRNVLFRKIQNVQDLRAKLAFVQHYKQEYRNLTEMRDYRLDNFMINKPLDKVRSGVIEKNCDIFNEGFEILWTFFLSNQSSEDIINAKLNLLDTCLIKTPDENLLGAEYEQPFLDYKKVVEGNFDNENPFHIEALRTFRDKLLNEHQ